MRIAMKGVLAALAAIAGSAHAAPPDRGDLAAAYLRFERAVALAPKDAATREQVNRTFDGLTGDFFAGRFDRALVTLAAAQAALPGGAPRGALEFLASNRASLARRTGVVGLPFEVRCAFEPLDGMPAGSPPDAVVVRTPTEVLRTTYGAPFGRTVELRTPGTIVVEAEFPGGFTAEIARAFVLAKPVDELRAGFEARVAALATKGGVPDSTLVSLKARSALLAESLERTRSAALLADLPSLADDLERELAAAERGDRPYARAGDVWRMFKVLGTELPTRQFVPEAKGPLPLLIAFHGAGGDENLFFDGYGGVLKSLASERGVAVVCPPTVPFGLSPAVLDRFIEEVARDIDIDRSRVLLVGHSMGAATASRLASLRPKAVRGAACIAGFSDVERKEPPAARRVWLAALDPLFALAPTQASVEAAARRSPNIELTVVPHEGHTLVVGEVLAQAIDWLLALRSAKAEPTASAPSMIPMKTGVPAPAASVASPIAGPMK
ncbi:MAG: alpha/beta hydrolase family protein [Phycisphaerales bacterium]